MSTQSHAQAKPEAKSTHMPTSKGQLQRAARQHIETGGIPTEVREVLRSPGQPLDPRTRAEMESRFGHDFSRVRVHSDVQAADSAEALNARAYTVGQNIVFGKGRTPGVGDGWRLLAHELAHVVQQQRGGTSIPSLISSNPLEQAANSAAKAVTQGRDRVRVAGASAPGLSRETDEEREKRLRSDALSHTSKMPRTGASPLGSLPSPRIDPEYLKSLDPNHGDQLVAQYDALRQKKVAAPPANAKPVSEPKFGSPEWLSLYQQNKYPAPRTEYEAQYQNEGLQPIYKDGMVVGYLGGSKGLPVAYNLEGKNVWESEIPLESTISPLDFIPFELVGSLVVDAGKLAVRGVVNAASRTARAGVTAAALASADVAPVAFAGVESRGLTTIVNEGEDLVRSGNFATESASTAGRRGEAVTSSDLTQNRPPTLIGSSTSQMRRNAARIIRGESNHPLQRALSERGGFKTSKGLAHSELFARPDILQMGHITSNKSGEPQRIMLQGAWENQLNNITVEHSSKGGYMVNEAVDIGGIAMDVVTAQTWEDLGWLPRGTVASAPKIR